jgi:hypothetical protein
VWPVSLPKAFCNATSRRLKGQNASLHSLPHAPLAYKNKINSLTSCSASALTPSALFIRCCGVPTSDVLPYQEPQRLRIRRPSLPPRRYLLASGEIHGDGAAVLQGSGRLSSTRRGALPTLGGALSRPRRSSSPHSDDHGAPRPHPPPSSPSQAWYYWRWCSCAAAHRRL